MCFQKYGDGGNNRGNLIFFFGTGKLSSGKKKRKIRGSSGNLDNGSISSQKLAKNSIFTRQAETWTKYSKVSCKLYEIPRNFCSHNATFESRNVKYCNKVRSPRRYHTKPRDPYGLKASLSFTIWTSDHEFVSINAKKEFEVNYIIFNSWIQFSELIFKTI